MQRQIKTGDVVRHNFNLRLKLTVINTSESLVKCSYTLKGIMRYAEFPLQELLTLDDIEYLKQRGNKGSNILRGLLD